jgi:VIT1/CCC1 family predicted Fe2+/Mn2+ transporter
MPWFFIGGTAAVVSSIGLVAVTAVILGILLAQATGRPAWRSAARQVLVSMLAAGVTYAVGRLVGVGVRG